ncbi:MAG: hypothetical protein HZB53_10420 [Chloroflexi bacterium]|nr:hypothetical protein [Chloroflexota bacterium]
MRIHPFFLPILMIVSVLGSIVLAQASGNWTTSGRTAIDPNTMTTADIKGWMTLQQVMDGLRLSPPDLYAAAGVPADVAPSTALKDLESLAPGFSITTLREKLTAAGSAATIPAAPVAATAAASTAAPTAIPVATAIPAATPAADHAATGTGAGPTPLPPGQVLAAKDIKGRMTLNEVAQQCAVPLDALVKGLKLPAGTSPATAIKDPITQGALTDVTDVQKVVEALQAK